MPLEPARVLRCPCGCNRIVSASHATLVLLCHDAPAAPGERELTPEER